MPLRPDTTLAKLNLRTGDNLPGWFGMNVVDVREGWLAMQLAIKPQMLAPNGYLHAASVIALADTASGYATIAHLPDGASNFTTIELKANFLGTATSGILRAEVSVDASGPHYSGVGRDGNAYRKREGHRIVSLLADDLVAEEGDA